MSSRLQLDMRNLSLGRRHLVNAYEVEAGIGVIAGNTLAMSPVSSSICCTHVRQGPRWRFYSGLMSGSVHIQA